MIFAAIITVALIVGLWLNQRETARRADAVERAESERAAREAAWVCPVCGHPVTTEPPYWHVGTMRVCSLSCARDVWPGREDETL